MDPRFSPLSSRISSAVLSRREFVSALRRKRAELSGSIPEAERRLASLREAVAGIDVTLRLFDPSANPADIKPKRTYKRRTSFARRELPCRVADEVRKASTPLSAHAIAALIAAGKGSRARKLSRGRFRPH